MAPDMLFAPCARGLEPLLAEELRALGVSRVDEARAGVAFTGGLEAGYRACLWSRLASRVLLRIAEVPAANEDELYASVYALPWEEHIGADSTLAVDFTASSRSPFTHTQYGAFKVKDAIVDRFRDRTGERPNVDTAAPDVLVNVASRTRSAVVSIDLSGEALHRRGYREAGIQVEAPLKETLAAAVLLVADWPAIAEAGGAFVDPLCGSGTLAIEAACIAGDRAPGLLRARWGFDGWLGHDEDVWHALLDEADERAEAAFGRIPPIRASDIDPRAVEVARACAKRAGLADAVSVERADVRELAPPQDATAGLIAFNPPYGERLGDTESVAALYRALGSRLRAAFPGWKAATIVSDESPIELLGIPAEHSQAVNNGRIPAHIVAGSMPPPLAESMFANRLSKNAKRLRKWARRESVTCYRVYDADMPEYAVAVDLYQGAGPNEGARWAHIAEYAPPKTVDAGAADRRLAEVLGSVPEVLGVATDDVSLKVRRRQRGTDQYEKLERHGSRRVVAENGLLFEVDFTSYLDTGLFLDHRITRAMVRERAAGTRFCNLFAYTGSVSVYAAAGGAASVTSVDLSATYLDWARANMRRNGFDAEKQCFERADVLEWLETQPAGSFDFIFCDPPTFSNSKRMAETFDVQRDQERLLTGAARVARTRRGAVVFHEPSRIQARRRRGAGRSGGWLARRAARRGVHGRDDPRGLRPKAYRAPHLADHGRRAMSVQGITHAGEYGDLPPFTVRRSSRARRVRLSVTPRDGLVIVLPVRAPESGRNRCRARTRKRGRAERSGAWRTIGRGSRAVRTRCCRISWSCRRWDSRGRSSTARQRPEPPALRSAARRLW